MWDRLLVDCSIATLEARARQSARAHRQWRDRHRRRQDRPRRQAHRARRFPREGGRRARRRWVTPGLIDCHTHLIFGGTRADEHAMRRAGATYEEIAKAGGGIASTVARTAAASDENCSIKAAAGFTR